MISLGADSSLDAYMTCMGDYEIKPHIYEEFVEKNNLYAY
jgi:hypothetical protein